VKGIGELLTKNELSVLLEVIHSTLTSVTEEHLIERVNDLKHLFDFEFAACALHRAKGPLDESHLINVSYPPAWFSLYIARGYESVNPVVLESARNWHDVQYWADAARKYGPSDFLSDAQDVGLRQGYSHGVRSPKGDSTSLFSFGGNSLERHPRTERILEHVVPHLDRVFRRILEEREKADSSRVDLSSREIEMLKWAKDGKTMWEISEILSISENTVKAHLSHIMKKLGVVNRAQAVAAALHKGLIDMD
jgi:DNA-binding CsgD family transcriptional regulator